jgi:phage shock protein E
MFKKLLVLTLVIVILYTILRIIEKKQTPHQSTDIIVDVRSLSEWNEWHHPRAIHIPYYQIENIQNVVKDKSKKIILYCSSARRANLARTTLFKHDYNNIEIMSLQQIKKYN